jgi:hypothetical protein
VDIRDFIEKIEPLQATTASASPEQDLQLMSITSIAISLKRVADRLEAITTLHGDGSLGQVNVGVEGTIDVRNNY